MGKRRQNSSNVGKEKMSEAREAALVPNIEISRTKTENARGYENTLKYVPMWRRGISDHAWGAYFLLCYYLFFPLTWKAWEPWDCSPYKVSNTTTIYTMDADPTEQCYGSEHGTYWNRLGPISIGFGIFYTLALPIYMAWIFCVYRKAIQKDQIRRKNGGTEGQSWRKDLAAIRLQTQVRGHNARRDYGTGKFYTRNQERHSTILVRKHYGKLYEDFKPKLYFWRLIQMLRKIALVFTIFVPSTAPSFQAALALLILFMFFVLQVKYRPYMKRNSFPQEDVGASTKIQTMMPKPAKTKIGPESSLSQADKVLRAKKRWRKAMMVARTEARWHHVTKSHARDALEWLFDYNSMEMLSLASAIIILLFGLMMKTYSPSTVTLRYVSNQNTMSYYVRLALDRGTITLFFIPVTLLASSLFLDLHRNLQYYRHHMSIEKMQLERKKMNVDASTAADKIREWREKENAKIEREIKLLTMEHDDDILRFTTLYNSRHDETEANLKEEMKKRVEVEELIHNLNMKTPENSSENKRIAKQIKDLSKQRRDIVMRVEHLNEVLTDLTVEYRKKKMHVHEKLEKLKQEKRSKLKQRLDKRLREQDKRMKRKYKKTYDKNMPVKMQCRVLVTKNKFDSAFAKHGKHLANEKRLTNRLKNSKSEVFDQHKKVMDNLIDNHVNTKDKIIENHEQQLEDIQNKLEDLRVDKNINEDQIRNLEEACDKQKNALLQELGKEKFEEHMKLLERIKLRKKMLQQKEGELNLRAKAESWSDEKLNDEINTIRNDYQSEVKGLLEATNVRQDAAHNRLMQRLMKIKGAEARNISALNAAGKASAEQIAAMHAKADDEVRDLLKESESGSDIVTDRVLHSMYDLNVQENDALIHLKENVSMSEEELASQIQAIHDRSAIASATISAEIAKNRSKRNEILLKRLAARKQREAIEITGAINLATITGKPKEEVQAEIAQIKTRAEKEIDMMMKNIGMRADKKHTKLMERLANRKAKEIHKIEEIRQSAQNNGDSIESVNSKIEAVKLAAEKDTEILVKALSDRGDKQKEKQSSKVFRAINKLAEISIIEDKANTKMQNLKTHESLMEAHIKDMEKNHQSELNGLQRKLNDKKNEQQDNLQKRLAQRRQQAKKAGLSKSERQKIEMETRAIEDLAETRRLREES